MTWSPHDDSRAPVLSQGGHRLVHGVGTVIGWIGQAVETLAFWTAVGLPVCYLPVVAGGLTGQEPITLVGLLHPEVSRIAARNIPVRDQWV